MVYGPGQIDLKKLLPYVILKTLAGESPQMTSGVRRVDWIYVDDVVSALLRMADAPAIDGMTIEIGSGSSLTVEEIVRLTMGMIDPAVEPKFGSVKDRPMEQERNADVEQTYARIGWRPQIDIRTGLRLLRGTRGLKTDPAAGSAGATGRATTAAMLMQKSRLPGGLPRCGIREFV
jgi:UDP-glucose 4-epimerase